MSAALIPPGKEAWLLVASASHMPRSIACFRETGWNIYPAPANYLTGGQHSSRLARGSFKRLWEIPTRWGQFEERDLRIPCRAHGVPRRGWSG